MVEETARHAGRSAEQGVNEFAQLDDHALIDELSTLTTQTARMRARMFDLMAELDRRRANAA
ncbi:hypothetical protein EDD29_8482 [Actinocorallia herbida]|uniref:Uncharacterized protein n=1 Tax=Actinocorallia herbida TaxID=58109 RepID=A0A3N1DB42_9ACTN|nr:hypothetical protein EDD29_8482 [Actinocorallia herbida]